MSSNNKKEWEERTLEPLRESRSERQKHFTTESGIEVKPLYDQADLEKFDYSSKLGYPGEYPYTRGVQPNMYRGRIWTMRQYRRIRISERI